MIMLSKTLVLLILELTIEYLFGTMLIKIILKREVNPGFSLLMGFFAYQALFQPITLAVVFSTGVLHHLTICWLLILTGTIVLSIALCGNVIKQQFKNGWTFLKKYKKTLGFVILIVAAFCYYVSVHGEDNEDARYYIALMTTSVDTDTMFQYNVYNGYKVGALYLRRMIATFEMHSAVLSQAFQIHPLLIARIFRACQNVILTSTAVYVCGRSLFWKKENEEAVEKSLYSVIAFWVLQLICADTIYMPGAFVLYRAYEAKAFTANLIVIFGFSLCAELLKRREKRMLFLLMLFLWGCAALSTSAFMVAGAECAVLLIPGSIFTWRKKRKWEKQNAG